MSPGRSRSQSTYTPNYSISTPNSPLLSRGFASLRRTHRHTSSATEQSQTVSAMIHPPTISASTPRHVLHQGTDSIRNASQGNGSSSNSGDETTAVYEPHIRFVPNVGMSTRCFVFDVIERTLHAGVVLKLGRYSDRNVCSDRLSFKSKVVSRCHAEIWQEDGKIFIKDTGSSSGTFVNRARLGPANTTSRPYTIHDGDIIQMGVDYKGGGQAMYRAVRIRFEVDRSSLQQSTFSRAAFRQLKQCLRTNLSPSANTNDTTTTTTTLSAPNLDQERKSSLSSSHEPSHVSLSRTSSIESTSSSMEVQECCICLYSIGPGQALFIAPCSHIYHYRCLRPILTQNFPGFSCPLCRTYSDLDATANIEKEQVEQILQTDRSRGRRKKEQPVTIHSDDNSSNGNIIMDQTGSAATASVPNSYASLRPGFDDETVMDIYSAKSVAPPSTNSPHHISSASSSSDDEDHQLAYHHHSETPSTKCDTAIGPAQHTTIPRQHKSTGTEGLLATTLVGSPSPFDTMMHQHTVPPPFTSSVSPATTISTTMPSSTPPSTIFGSSSPQGPHQHT